MDTLYYNIDKENTNFMNISKDVPFFDSSKVTYFPVAFAASVNIATLLVVFTPLIVSIVALIKGILIRKK